MLKRLTSITLVAALVSVLCVTSAFANHSTDLDVRTDSTPARKVEKPNEQLKNNMLKLVADAREGKVAPAERPQIQPAKSNNLSKGTKVAIGDGIAVAVIAVILIVRPALNDGQ